ncbi:MAG: hypothetical protein H6744_01405 [Deltaproteobacteria bacterium]|nr:hypothetical protein [Deltaproteobacteria bacterium]
MAGSAALALAAVCKLGQCVPPATGCCTLTDCCEAHASAGCSDAATGLCVCAADPFCCTVQWDDTCAAAVGPSGACGSACLCAPDCGGLACGDDGCGGSCGSCGEGEACLDGACVEEQGIAGNTCASPFEVGALPAAVSGDTGEATNGLAFSNEVCPGQAFGRGAASADQVWRVAVDSDLVLQATLEAAFDSVLYVVADCGDVDGSCLGAQDVFAAPEMVAFKASAGVDYFIVVDGWSNLSNVSGTYSLGVEALCTPQCEGEEPGTVRQCGDDGCGYACGTCPMGDLCDPTGQCTPGEALDGNTCANPFVVAGVPFADTGLTAEAASALGLPDGACGLQGAHGAQAADHVYRVDPPATGWYPITLLADFDAVVYGLTDCDSPASACVGAGLVPAGESTELELRLPGGVPSWVVVDGASEDAAAVGSYALAIGEPCLPACDGLTPESPKQCGDDGCGHTCGTCAEDESCTEGLCVVCVPQCDGQECGDDGCGGSCGQCSDGQVCDGGLCLLPELVPGATCANAIAVDALPFALDASTAKTSADLDASGCAGAVPGATGGASSDLVLAFTPPVSAVYTVTVEGDFHLQLYLLGDCADPAGSCLAHDWTPDSGSATLSAPLEAGTTVYVVVDGWDDVDDASGTFSLAMGAPCSPSCAGVACGGDGCGGSCGDCAEGTLCYEGACLAYQDVPGNTCAAPIAVTALPASFEGETTNLSPSVGLSAATCPGVSGAVGAGSSDAIYQLQVPESGVVTARLEADFDSALYVAEDCGDIDGTCLAADDAFGAPETVRFLAAAGTPYTVVVDGWSPTTDVSGAYTLSFEPLCLQKCAGKQCGPDGCGLSCGTCPVGDLCGFKGACIDGDTIPGNTCANPFKIFNVPYSKAGNTAASGNAYAIPDGETCEGLASAKGGASRDQVYRFFPPETGVYTARLEANFDSVLILADTCDVVGTCMAGSDLLPGAVESITFFGQKGQVYTLVVDGSGNLENIAGTYTLSIAQPCHPACTGKSCGPDGCGLTCGSCAPGEICEAASGTCSACTPACELAEGGGAKQCGDDGCGGECGACGVDEGCVDGLCFPLNSCAGHCGDAGAAPGPGPTCHCDSFCFGFGDCCYDICEAGACMDAFASECQ